MAHLFCYAGRCTMVKTMRGFRPRAPTTFCKKWAKTFLGERPRCASGLRKYDKSKLDAMDKLLRWFVLMPCLVITPNRIFKDASP